MTEADRIAAAAAAAGATAGFGVPGGGSNLEVIGALERRGIPFTLMHGETAAVIAAGVAGELTGRPGIAICTRGPGLTAAANGIAQAALDFQPVVVVTDGAGHRHPHQRLDHAQVVAPISKGTAVPADAFAHAVAVPWGPVVVDVGGPSAPQVRQARIEGETGADFDLDLTRFSRPVIVVGVGCRWAIPQLRTLVRGTAIPVLTSYKAKGAIPESWPNFAGLFTATAMEAAVLEAADLILLIGVDPVEFVPATWLAKATVISLHPWEADLRPVVPTARAVVGKLELLLPRVTLDDGGWERPGVSWREEAWRPLDVEVPGLAPQDVVRTVRAVMPAETVATVDAGAHMLVAMPFFSVEEPGRCLISSGLATMGFALPAAIGASAVVDAPIVALTGDGGLGMCLAEIETIGRLAADIRVIVFNDAALSLIEIKQSAGQGGLAAVRYTRTDFARVAEGMGIRAVSPPSLDALAGAVAARGPSLIDVAIDPSGYAAILGATRRRGAE